MSVNCFIILATGLEVIQKDWRREHEFKSQHQMKQTRYLMKARNNFEILFTYSDTSHGVYLGRSQLLQKVFDEMNRVENPLVRLRYGGWSSNRLFEAKLSLNYFSFSQHYKVQGIQPVWPDGYTIFSNENLPNCKQNLPK